jgi:hypothetical protein
MRCRRGPELFSQRPLRRWPTRPGFGDSGTHHDDTVILRTEEGATGSQVTFK